VAILEIKNPMAIVHIRWLSPEDGGRTTGPPSAPVYAATAVFKLGGESEVMPGWPATADQISILVERSDPTEDGVESGRIGFLVPDLARPFVRVGAEFLIMEGPRVVAGATVIELLAEPKDA